MINLYTERNTTNCKTLVDVRDGDERVLVDAKTYYVSPETLAQLENDKCFGGTNDRVIRDSSCLEKSLVFQGQAWCPSRNILTRPALPPSTTSEACRKCQSDHEGHHKRP